MAKAIVAFSKFCEHALKNYISHTRKIGVINDMGYDRCECGGKGKIIISRISFLYLGQTDRKAFPYLCKNHLKVIQ